MKRPALTPAPTLPTPRWLATGVACPYCHQPSGSLCLTPKARPASEPHKDRVHLLEAAS